jgi:hypothetical protein
VKRDKYAGMPRKKRRHLQRLEAWAKQDGGQGDDDAPEGEEDAPAKKKRKKQTADETAGASLGLPNQKLFARQAKVAERNAAPTAKRANPFAESGPAKRKAPAAKPTAAERDAAAAAKARAKAKAERALPARKVRSRSKPKFSKARKR